MNIYEFLNTFFTTDYFLILLIILLLLILVLSLHLIKYHNIEKEEKTEEKDNLDNLFINFMDSKEELVNVTPETISNFNVYEHEEEDLAIISNEELKNISKIRNMNDNTELINQYEMEQEKKAIISYEELLKNASNLKMNYKEPSNDEGPLIRKVELETPVLERNLSYIEETDFLMALKEFRSNLK